MQSVPKLGSDQLEALQKQAALLSKLPVVSSLLADPGAVKRLSAQSPHLSQVLASNPLMTDMLQPQAVSQLLQAAQDPQSLSSYLGQSGINATMSTHCLIAHSAHGNSSAAVMHHEVKRAAYHFGMTGVFDCSSTARHARGAGETWCQHRHLSADASSVTDPGTTQDSQRTLC